MSSPETTSALPPVSPQEIPGWRGIGFRFGVAYLLLHNATAGVALIPGLGDFGERLAMLLKHGAAWVGRHVLGITREIPVGLTGSSDTTADWIRVAIFLGFAALVAAGWSVAAHRTRWDAIAGRWSRIGLRYVLGAAMLTYGFMKLIPPTQFPEISLSQLTAPIGEASPQGLLWRFMGFSPVYVAFLGAGEVVAGALLFFRRTTLAGALVTAAIMANVVLLNLSYDVPVKLYSAHLLLMAAWLAWPDLPRLANLLLLNRPVPAVVDDSAWPGPSARRLALGLRLVVFAGIAWQALGTQLATGAKEADQFGVTPPELRGIWQVESFRRDGAPVPPLATDLTRWHTLIFGDYRAVLARRLDGKRAAFWFVRHDPTTGAYQFENPGNGGPPLPVAIILPGDGRMLLALTQKDAALEVALKRVDEREFTLLKRGFHWITETSFNR